MFHHMLALVVRTNMNDENMWESLTWLCLYVSLVSDMVPGLLLVEPLDSMTDDDCFHSSLRWRQLQPGLQFRRLHCRLRIFLREADEIIQLKLELQSVRASGSLTVQLENLDIPLAWTGVGHCDLQL